MYYYAKLNENQICIEILSRARELPKDLDGFIKIPDYNETLLWRKWDGIQWSQETYEPSFEVELQDRIKTLEEKVEIDKEEKENLNNKVNELESVILELNQIIAQLQGGNE